MFKLYKYLLCCILLTACDAGITSSAKADGDSKLYTQYNYSSFSLTDNAQQKIVLDDIDYELLNAAIHFETNSQRESNGLSTLQHSARLERAANEHASAMVKFDFFSHSSPVRGHATLVKRLKQVGIENVYAAENIAISFIEAEAENSRANASEQAGVYNYINLARSIVNQWMSSPVHKKNILNPKYQFLGNGTALFYNEKGLASVKTVQNFSSRLE